MYQHLKEVQLLITPGIDLLLPNKPSKKSRENHGSIGAPSRRPRIAGEHDPGILGPDDPLAKNPEATTEWAQEIKKKKDAVRL